jgi:mono/diheme cytochrome c family protein
MNLTRVMTMAIAAAIALVAAASTASAGTTPERGEKVYAEQKCAMCHSIAGKGNAKGPLDGVGTKLKADEIREWIVDPKTMTEKTKAARKPLMKAYPSLPKDDLDGLVAYMLSLKKK